MRHLFHMRLVRRERPDAADSTVAGDAAAGAAQGPSGLVTLRQRQHALSSRKLEALIRVIFGAGYGTASTGQLQSDGRGLQTVVSPQHPSRAASVARPGKLELNPIHENLITNESRRRGRRRRRLGAVLLRALVQVI